MHKFRALLVDDEEELVSTLVERLGYRGIKADYALNGADALRKMCDGSFDVVVLDLKMPGMSGFELMEILKAKYPDVPVLLITGHGSPTDELDEIPEEAYDYLAKPINLEDLIIKLREAVKSG